MIQTRIKQRFDTESNWLTSDVILLNGELAVVDCGQQIRFKIGNGVSSFNQLKYVDQNQLCTTWLIANAISQGIHAKSVPYGIAGGAYLSANANFSQAFGYDVQTVSTDTYSFAWNGDDTRVLYDYYSSHGKGTFNINPLSGLSGVYIGEQSLAQILENNSGNRITIDDRISNIIQQTDLSIVKLSASEYATLLANNEVLSNCLYIVNDSYRNAYGQQLKNLATPTDLSDAATKEYVDNSVSSLANITLSIETLQDENDSQNDQISALCNEISIAINDYNSKTNVLSDAISHKIVFDDRISGINGYNDLSIVKLSANEYASLLTSNTALSNALYIVTDSYRNAYGQQLKNLAVGTDLSDAVTLGQLDNAISTLSNDLALPIASTSALGGIKIGFTQDSSNHNYPVQLSNQQAYVNVPWTDVAVESAWYVPASHQIVIKFNDATADQISINVADLVDTYQADGTTLSLDQSTNTFSVKDGVFQEFGNYVSATTLNNYYEKTETSSAIQINAALSTKSTVTFVDWED